MNRVLEIGCMGDDVRLFQHFLIGNGRKIVASGTFDKETCEATKAFQKSYAIRPFDGIAGQRTLGIAISLGMPVDALADADDLPLPPSNLMPYGELAMERVFGKIQYISEPTKLNLEAIRVTNDWRKHLRTLDCAYKGLPKKIQFHEAGIDDFSKLLDHWNREKLLNRIVTWNGSYSARFKRGSRTDLSRHSWATAFDINAETNKLGIVPPFKGEGGCVRELVEIANEHHFFWGGHFKARRDGMHFELAEVLLNS